MDKHRPSSHVNLTAESAHLVKALVDKHRHDVLMEPDDNSPDGEMTKIYWVSAEDFTIEVGEKQIEDYIQTWEIQPRWLHSLDFLATTEEEHHIFHHYRARFSTPTPQKPIQGTASVYFIVDVSKVKPETLPVEVRYVVESNRLVHTPGKTKFKEEWLSDIIDSKILLQNMVQL